LLRILRDLDRECEPLSLRGLLERFLPLSSLVVSGA
jgi:hypothetical protein